MSLLLLLLAVILPQRQLLPFVSGGSCREAQLCCNGRDSSCVVQKAPINAIIEDLSDKPCYCDHACLKLGDCCDDFKDHCGGVFRRRKLKSIHLAAGNCHKHGSVKNAAAMAMI
uniref:IP03234p n=1 Tax=Drosophila melanogaster TaxID=7227 RepID=Q4V446_DROME|eukprot:NP_652466.2 uncharacterized protein Dmel_CG42339, isoform A [Drosophila melanogaster]